MAYDLLSLCLNNETLSGTKHLKEAIAKTPGECKIFKWEVIQMELMPWRPLSGLSPFRKEMDDLWNRFFNDIPRIRRFEGEWSPFVDVSETKDSYIVKAELPGLESKDVNVSISGNVLRREEKRDRVQVKINNFQPSPGHQNGKRIFLKRSHI